jgi:hypothetical protein
LTQATEVQNPKRHKTKASSVFSDTIPKDLATLSRRIVGINLHKQLSVSVTSGLFIFLTSIVICGQLQLKYQRLHERALAMKPCTGKLLFKTKASLLKINQSFFRGTGSPGTFKLGSTVISSNYTRFTSDLHIKNLFQK